MSIMNFRNKILPVFILLLILYCAFFLHLSHHPLRLWDETRQAFNAYEMSVDGDLLVTKFKGQPDMWNLKPPFLIWCQSLFIKVIGPWEFSIRLPSAFAGFLTSLMIFIFIWKVYDRFWLGWIAAVVLSTCKGYMTLHGARTGDYDSLLTFFEVFYTLSFLLFFERGKWKYYYWAIAGIILAVLTKGIAGLLFLPAIAIAVLFFKKAKLILSSRHFYFSFIIFAVIIGGFYLLRDHYNPGYIQAVIDNEWSGRYMEVIEDHKGSFWFYFENIHTWMIGYWALLIPCGLIVGLLDKDERFKRFIIYITIICIIFWLILSLSQTKILWYIYPAFPLLSVLVATFIYYIFKIIDRIETPVVLRYKILPYAFLLIICFKPYHEIIDLIYLAPETSWDKPVYRMSYYLRDLAKGNIQMDKKVNVVFENYTHHLEYYIQLVNKDGERARLKQKETLEAGDFVICSEVATDNYLRDHYQFEEIIHNDDLYAYNITGKK